MEKSRHNRGQGWCSWLFLRTSGDFWPLCGRMSFWVFLGWFFGGFPGLVIFGHFAGGLVFGWFWVLLNGFGMVSRWFSCLLAIFCLFFGHFGPY